MSLDLLKKPEDNDVGSTTGSEGSFENYEGFNDHVQGQVLNLAKTISHISQTAAQRTETTTTYDLGRYLTHMSVVPGVEPFHPEEIDPRLDPDLDEFQAKFWVKNLRKLYDSNAEYYKPSSLGVAYRNLRARGIAADSDYQPTVGNGLMKLASDIYHKFRRPPDSAYFDILKPMDGLIRPGEVTVVLGRPGSGCTTLLKTISSHTYGFDVDPNSIISYDGLTPHDIDHNFRGDVMYSAETDVHFPNLQVGDTLEFAARMRTPQNRGNIDRETYAKHMAAVYMAMYGVSHTRYTKVGNDFIRGVSGGERKRVSIAEASLSGANIQCWDNATRGLDAATALEFIRALKTSATILEATPLIAIYQCSQDAYDLFDNAVVLYEGYQIFFGKSTRAKAYFEEMGYECPQRQTTADFLTSLTNPAERVVKPGYENKVPRTAKEFDEYWKNSTDFAKLNRKIDEYLATHDGESSKADYQATHVARQSDHIKASSPYTVSFGLQVKYIMHRNWLRTKGDPSFTIFTVLSQVVMALILSSVFYNMKGDTESFFFRGAAIFLALLYNAFSSVLEIFSLYEGRPIVEKHKQFALYRPGAEALASIITELPSKLMSSLGFNLIFYFMVNFRRDAGHFFFYWFVGIIATLMMSHIFRSIGAATTSLSSALTPTDGFLSALITYTGYVLPVPYMKHWFRWINYLDPLAYMFEALMVNEFGGRKFDCTSYLPSGGSYDQYGSQSKACNVVGSVPGQNWVSGTQYIKLSFKYETGHKWRNVGIGIGFTIFFLGVYVFLSEINKGSMQKGEITLYLRDAMRRAKKAHAKQVPKIEDLETGNLEAEKGITNKEKIETLSAERSVSSSESKEEHNNIFHWRDLTYQVRIKTEDRVILNHVDGWVKPGQITALMGASGAGKTTLLNCLSERVTSGIITDGVRLVDGKPLDNSFQRSIGYAQQQDLHLPTSTVREALRFSAHMRQPEHVSKEEKDDYVEYVIDLLEMRPYSDALVGVAGEGLNVEQRKRLTIGVELAAKPKLLVFLDEPTSGLDSQTAWSVCKLMRKLADHGQAILCTIHQPSAILLKEFDRLLFLQKGGKTVYFGDLGENFKDLTGYFEKYGAHPCPKEANPAEWMLEVIGAAPGSHASQDYHEVWKNSSEYQDVQGELDRMERELGPLPKEEDAEATKRYATTVFKQWVEVTRRTLVQNWRTPSYIYAKFCLVIFSSLFNGFSFYKADTSLQGLQNQMFSVFITLVPLNTLVQQMLPTYIKQRDLYEVREAPSRTFSWVAFITSQIASEIPFQIVCGTIAFFTWYYPVGLYRNAEGGWGGYGNQVNSRGVLVWMFLVTFHVYIETFGQACIALFERDLNAANLSSVLFTLCLTFCGVMAPKDSLPGFWIFMYRVSPFTYMVQGIMSTAISNTKIVCRDKELVRFLPPENMSCGQYMSDYINQRGGYLVDSSATLNCAYCTLDNTNQYLATIDAFFDQRWRNWGIFLSYIFINIGFTIFFYWWARVPKHSRQKK